ncbi:MAG: hypothetical protein KIC61_02505 [Staphylococcus sp.]|jgi:hypothetical protein|nr:hypothetical protein [Staphylococcus sp.]
MNINEIIVEFNYLLEQPKSNEIHIQIIALLQNVINNKDSETSELIWAYWNISDRFALLRRHDNTYKNHLRFESYLNSLNNENYKLMLICDTTQRLSLTEGGYYNYYRKLFMEIIENIKISDDNYIIYFECLRTALYDKVYSCDDEIRNIAIVKLEELIKLYENDSQILRIKLVYYIIKLRDNKNKFVNDEEILKESYKIFLSLYPYLKTKEYITTLFGTYDNWNQKRSMWYQARSINDYIITLIQCGYYELANKCYEIIGKEEFKSTYFIKHIDFMKQKIKNK